MFTKMLLTSYLLYKQNMKPIINPNIFPCIGELNSLCFLTFHFHTNTDIIAIVVKVLSVVVLPPS